VVYNVGLVCLYVCKKFIFAVAHPIKPVYLDGILVKFVYEGYWVKVKVKGATKDKKIPIPAM